MAQSIYDVHCLMKYILSSRHSSVHPMKGDGDKSSSQLVTPVKKIVNACHVMFRECFHVFYPSGVLKWYAACRFLERLDPVSLLLRNVCICMYMYIHMYIRTYNISMYTHIYIRTCIHPYIRTYICTYIRTYIYVHTYVYTYTLHSMIYILAFLERSYCLQYLMHCLLHQPVILDWAMTAPSVCLLVCYTIVRVGIPSLNTSTVLLYNCHLLTVIQSL